MALISENYFRCSTWNVDYARRECGGEIAAALKQSIAAALRGAMETECLTKAKMAERMGTSRNQLDRLLDPKDHSVTLKTLARAAHSLGRTWRIDLA